MQTLTTKRLILREFKPSDLADFFAYSKVEGVGEMAGWSHHKTIETSKKILDQFINDKDVYAIVDKKSNKVIGSLGMHKRTKAGFEHLKTPEIGYVLSKDYWGLGLMTEAVQKVIDYLFENTDVDILFCGYFSFNEKSKRVVEKCGFKFLKIEEKQLSQLDNKVVATHVYMLNRHEYFAKSMSSITG